MMLGVLLRRLRARWKELSDTLGGYSFPKYSDVLFVIHYEHKRDPLPMY